MKPIIQYPSEIRLELIAQELEDGKRSVTQETHLREIAIELHDMRFELAEARDQVSKEKRNALGWFRVCLLLVVPTGAYLIHSLIP